MLHIPEHLLIEIRMHGEEHYPEEGAGLILGRDDGDQRVALHIMPITNSFSPDSRHNRYLIRPQDMMEAEEVAEGLGMDVIGVFHSHPDHPARPSEFDRERALPWYSYLITSIHDKRAHKSRSWRLSEDRIFIEEGITTSTNITNLEVK